jgi:hypothetical protein
MEKFSQTKVGTIIREKLRKEAKCITFRREHPELKLPPIAEVQKLLACLR